MCGLQDNSTRYRACRYAGIFSSTTRAKMKIFPHARTVQEHQCLILKALSARFSAPIAVPEWSKISIKDHRVRARTAPKTQTCPAKPLKSLCSM